MCDEDLQPQSTKVDADSTSSDHDAAMPVAVSGNPAADSSSPRFKQPRLSIVHLLLWTFFCAVVIGVDQLTIELAHARKDFANVGIGGFLAGLPMQAALAANLMGFTVLSARRFQGGRARFEPGEWLLVVQSIVCVVGISFSIYNGIRVGLQRTEWAANPGNIRRDPEFQQVQAIRMAILRGLLVAESVIAFAGYFVVTLMYRERGAWRRFFVIATVISALWVASMILFYFHRSLPISVFRGAPLAAYVLGATFLLLAVLGDLKRKRVRGWLHWWGVGAFASLNGASALWRVIDLFH